MSDINDTKAAAGATAAEGKSAPQARRNAATQGAPRGAPWVAALRRAWGADLPSAAVAPAAAFVSLMSLTG